LNKPPIIVLLYSASIRIPLGASDGSSARDCEAGTFAVSLLLRRVEHQLPAALDIGVDFAQFLFGNRVLGWKSSQGIEPLRKAAPEAPPLDRVANRLTPEIIRKDAHWALSSCCLAEPNLRFRPYKFEIERGAFS
jgi:hypothetical protein